MDMSGLTLISVVGFKYIQGYCNALDILYAFSLNLFLELSFLTKTILRSCVTRS